MAVQGNGFPFGCNPPISVWVSRRHTLHPSAPSRILHRNSCQLNPGCPRTNRFSTASRKCAFDAPNYLRPGVTLRRKDICHGEKHIWYEACIWVNNGM